jgi:putative ubiquitin-RnfH superfamily antitoxin RatB of RatAB toxin-antitoxin module
VQHDGSALALTHTANPLILRPKEWRKRRMDHEER